MAYYYGPQTIDITSYDTFRNAVNGNGYDVDYSYGAQCVDAFMLLNYNVGGYPYPYLRLGENGHSYEMWTDVTARLWNASDKYLLIYNKEQIKRGDMVVFSASYYYPTFGHNAFADEDYNPSDPDHLMVLGQNQLYGATFPTGGKCFNVEQTILGNLFLGAFRLIQWQHGPGPTPQITRSKFPWYLVARKLRNRRV